MCTCQPKKIARNLVVSCAAQQHDVVICQGYRFCLLCPMAEHAELIVHEAHVLGDMCHMRIT